MMALFTTGQFVVGLLFILGLGFYYLCVLGMVVAMRYKRAEPKLQGIFITAPEKGVYIVKERRVLKPAGSFSSEWQLRSSDRNKVRFKVKPKGIGKSEEREWSVDDFMEFNFGDNEKKLVIFGWKSFLGGFYSQLQRLKQDRDHQFNLRGQMEIQLKQMEADSRVQFNQFLEDHKKANRSGPIITKSGGGK